MQVMLLMLDKLNLLDSTDYNTRSAEVGSILFVKVGVVRLKSPRYDPS